MMDLCHGDYFINISYYFFMYKKIELYIGIYYSPIYNMADINPKQTMLDIIREFYRFISEKVGSDKLYVFLNQISPGIIDQNKKEMLDQSPEPIFDLLCFLGENVDLFITILKDKLPVIWDQDLSNKDRDEFIKFSKVLKIRPNFTDLVKKLLYEQKKTIDTSWETKETEKIYEELSNSLSDDSFNDVLKKIHYNYISYNQKYYIYYTSKEKLQDTLRIFLNNNTLNVFEDALKKECSGLGEFYAKSFQKLREQKNSYLSK